MNKRDFDFQVSLYELTSDKDYVQLAPFWSRVQDRVHRHLLDAGKRQTLDFRVRLMSRLLKAGSRVVAVIGVVKEPLQITWYAGSYLDLPIHL